MPLMIESKEFYQFQRTRGILIGSLNNFLMCVSYFFSSWTRFGLPFFTDPDEVNSVCVCADRFSHVWLFATLWTIPSRTLCPGDSPGKNTRVGSHVLLREPSWIRDQTHVSFVSCVDKQVLCYSHHLGSP